MAENKRYITQPQENGSVMISEDVVAAIAEHALVDVDGASFQGDIRKNWTKSMKITIAEDNTVSVSVNIAITCGYSVVDVANNVQNVITTAVENMTGVKVTEVNVNVCGIAR